MRISQTVSLIGLLSSVFINVSAQTPTPMNRIDLHRGWNLQSSCKAKEPGDVISTLKFQPKGWYATTVPMTVLAAQVTAGEFKKPYYGINFKQIPGVNYSG